MDDEPKSYEGGSYFVAEIPPPFSKIIKITITTNYHYKSKPCETVSQRQIVLTRRGCFSSLAIIVNKQTSSCMFVKTSKIICNNNILTIGYYYYVKTVYGNLSLGHLTIFFNKLCLRLALLTFSIYSLAKIFLYLIFDVLATPSTKYFNAKFFPNYGRI